MPRIVSAVVAVKDELFEGVTHSQALDKAMVAGAVRKNKYGLYVDRDGLELWGSGWSDLFRTSDGRLIDRWKATQEFGIAAAEQLKPNPDYGMPPTGDDQLIWRRARKAHKCWGRLDRGRKDPDRHASGCTPEIQPGEMYLECRWESLPFESGFPVCRACAEAFFRERGQAQANPARASLPGTINSAFWNWFGASRVTNKRGMPLVVYHGTPDAREFTRFETAMERLQRRGYGREDYQDPNRVFWFTSERRVARTYSDPHRAFDFGGSQPRVMTFYLRILHPLEINAHGQPRTGFRGAALKAQDSGYDGLIIRNVVDDYQTTKRTRMSDVFAVFDPRQIKRVYNQGTWDPESEEFAKNPERYWGRAGAGVLLTCEDKILLVLRSQHVQEPGTWGIPGGSCSGEAMFPRGEGQEVNLEVARDCALRELIEELGPLPENMDLDEQGIVTYRDPRGFTYTTFIMAIWPERRRRLDAGLQLNWENDDARWFTIEEALALPNLHFGARYVLEQP